MINQVESQNTPQKQKNAAQCLLDEKRNMSFWGRVMIGELCIVISYFKDLLKSMFGSRPASRTDFVIAIMLYPHIHSFARVLFYLTIDTNNIGMLVLMFTLVLIPASFLILTYNRARHAGISIYVNAFMHFVIGGMVSLHLLGLLPSFSDLNLGYIGQILASLLLFPYIYISVMLLLLPKGKTTLRENIGKYDAS